MYANAINTIAMAITWNKSFSLGSLLFMLRLKPMECLILYATQKQTEDIGAQRFRRFI